MNRTSSLPPAIDAHCPVNLGRAGSVRYYAAGEGRPLLLLHSINAAASAREVRLVFDHFRESRRVYAPDLPGFGRSDRSPRDYSVQLYCDAILDMIDVIHGDAAPEPVDVMAVSLTSEFVARVASEAPQLFRSLTFVSATGFQKGSDKLRQPKGSTLEKSLLSKAFNVSMLRGPLYRWLVRPESIRENLERIWGSQRFDRDLAEYADLSTHQPDAENAPLAFLSGRLSSGDIRTVYESLRLPIWLPHGTKGEFIDYSGPRWTRERPNWTLTAYDSGALPFFEQTEPFMADYADIMERASSVGGWTQRLE